MRMKNGEVEIRCLPVVTDPAFVEGAVVLQDECLAQLALAKTKKDGCAKLLASIGNDIKCLRLSARESICIGTIREAETGLRFKTGTVVASFGRAGH